MCFHLECVCTVLYQRAVFLLFNKMVRQIGRMLLYQGRKDNGGKAGMKTTVAWAKATSGGEQAEAAGWGEGQAKQTWQPLCSCTLQPAGSYLPQLEASLRSYLSLNAPHCTDPILLLRLQRGRHSLCVCVC